MTWFDRVAALTGQRLGTNGVILCLHGLRVDGEPDRPSMHIAVSELEALVRAVRNMGELAPLDEVVVRYRAGRSTAGLVAITADDAYASWLLADSLLRRHDIPLTIFPVTDALATGPTFWWDRLDDSASLADTGRWREFEKDCGLPDAYRVGQPVRDGPARPLRQWILAEHAGRLPMALEGPFSRLESELGHHTPQRSMTTEELGGFVARTGAQVGVHTRSHAALPFLTDVDLVAEIKGGYDAVRKVIPGALPYLAIPFGLFDARTLRLAAEAGMAASLTLEGNPLDRPLASEIGLPRLCVMRGENPGVLTLKASRVGRLLGRFRRGSGPKGDYPVLPSATT